VHGPDFDKAKADSSAANTLSIQPTTSRVGQQGPSPMAATQNEPATPAAKPEYTAARSSRSQTGSFAFTATTKIMDTALGSGE